MDWQEKDGLKWLEAELPGARAAFSTRLGGVSEGDFESLNIGVLTDDDTDNVLENRKRLTGALGRDIENIVIGRQVHEIEVLEHRGPQDHPWFAEPDEHTPEVDGHIILRGGGAPPEDVEHEQNDIAGLVFVADCLPVVLAGPAGVAILHCGWRGLAGGIIARGADAVQATAAAIGPGIGPCCYEVGEEVLEAFENLGDGIADGRMLDLTEICRRMLDRANVEDVETSGCCTSCESELFFSHRRDEGRTGRQAGLGWIEA